MTSESPLIISFYTDDWQYPQHADRLRGECDRLGLAHHIERRPSAGGYLENTCQKPTFIRECLQRYGRPVLWIDVDGSIRQKPEHFREPGWDFQARRMPSHRPRTWHVGTMYWAPTPAALAFVDDWIGRTGDMSDESSLEQSWRALGHTLAARDIPATYFEIPTRRQPMTPQCVIFHRLSDGDSKRAQTSRFNAAEQAEADALRHS